MFYCCCCCFAAILRAVGPDNRNTIDNVDVQFGQLAHKFMATCAHVLYIKLTVCLMPGLKQYASLQ